MSNKLKLKVRTKLPAALVGRTGIAVSKDGLTYNLDLDYSRLAQTSQFDPINDIFAVWNKATGVWNTINPASFVAGSFYSAIAASQTAPDGVSLVSIQRTSPSTTSLTLPSLANQGGRAIVVLDWSTSVTNHAITITPAGGTGTTIMKAANWIINSSASQAAAVVLYPSLDLNSWYIAPLSNFLQAGTGAVPRTFQNKARDFISVKDFGAVGDGVTNDTAAINLAIAATNATDPNTLHFPAGKYLVTPNGLSTITCNVYGPAAVLIGSSNIDGIIVSLNYHETYPVTLNGGVVGLGIGKTFEMLGIIGYNDAAKVNVGIYCVGLDEAIIKVGYIRGCRYGLWLDGAGNDAHMGTNDIFISHLFACQVGIVASSGTSAGKFMESNHIRINYAIDFTVAGISFAGGSTIDKLNNVIEIDSIGANVGSGGTPNIIWFDAFCKGNKVTIRSWDAGVPAGGKLIVTGGSNNLWRVPAITPSLITSTGTDIWDTVTETIDGTGRSQISGTASPTSLTWRPGDVCWNTGPTATSVPGWVCTTAGAPGTWSVMTPLGLADASANVTAAKVTSTASAGATGLAVLTNTSAAAGDVGVIVKAGATAATADTTTYFIAFNDVPGTNVGGVKRNGANAVAYATASDERLKLDRGISKRGLDDLLKIEVRDFAWKSNPDSVVEGVFAQQLHGIYPEAVSVGGDDPAEKPWSVDYGRLTPLLVRAIQQLEERLAAAEARTKGLEAGDPEK